MLIDEATAVDDAEHARLVAKAEADGIQPTFAPESAPSRLRDRLARLRRGALRPARAARRTRTSSPGSCRPRRSRRADDFDNIVVLGMGGSGIVGRRRAGRRHRDPAGAARRAQALPHAGVRRARARSRSRSRTRATPRRRSRWRAARTPPARPSSRSRRGGALGAVRAGAGCVARAVPRRHPGAAARARRDGRAAVRDPVPHGHAPRGARGDAARAAAARAPARPVQARRRSRPQPGARAGAQDRPHHPDHLRDRRARWRRRDALEAVDERERQGARVLEHVPRARPQRGVRLGPARRRHPPAVHPGRAARTAWSTRSSRGARPRRARSSKRRCTRCCTSRPKARGGSRSCSTSCTSATGPATTSRSPTTSTPARSTRSAS